ncbi:alpha-N-arabinofuranosidase [Streptomyces cellostaticus]|uniref:Alpha-N-arabinofuranosidase n=1 Tax=Streptomyces cellostaticus TaxID=67285 RepID=A0A124HDI6_9ACTN|nr:alpha-L-arabinofuranosidase B [Streptomyces cellostaticus]KUM97716.1 alpha-N-arabinofuranosidase [Streptomyces cellostaticus]GHI08136.1 alpha-N-arabinofuranosidase [Streptomyces cellostaticus]
MFPRLLRSCPRRLRSAALSVLATLATVAALVVGVGAPQAAAASSLPCDVYAAAGTPCVAAHSLVRALYSSYNGSLYQVKRASDGATANIGLLSAGGYANAAAQDSFCSGTTCIITEIYDQSPRHNHLTVEGAGGAGAADVGAPADALPVTVGGHQVYGLEISAGMGYRDNSTSGVAVNGQAEGMYMVTSGTHVNGSCCFDYGNAETNNKDTGNGHMDAINFGTECWFSPCYGQGPWVQADLENGLFQSDAGYSKNTSNTGTGPLPFVTALLKNNGQNHFALKYGNAQNGGLTTTYSGGEPTASGYSPMHQEGAIVLGTGGDNSNGSIGSFFEGVMTSGIPTDAADNAVQADIVSAGYGGPTGSTGTLNAGSEISLRATTSCCTTDYIRHQNNAAVISPVASGSSSLDKNDATWIVRRGLADSSCVSFESRNYPGDFLRHFDYRLYRQPMDGTSQFRSDATFCPQTGKSGTGTSFASYNYPTKYLRHYNSNVYLASNGGSNAWDSSTSWSNDVSWAVSSPWAP